MSIYYSYSNNYFVDRNNRLKSKVQSPRIIKLVIKKIMNIPLLSCYYYGSEFDVSFLTENKNKLYEFDNNNKQYGLNKRIFSFI